MSLSKGISFLAYALGWHSQRTRISSCVQFELLIKFARLQDFFFVPPYLTFAVADMAYLITFTVMLFVALVISTLTIRLRSKQKPPANASGVRRRSTP